MSDPLDEFLEEGEKETADYETENARLRKQLASLERRLRDGRSKESAVKEAVSEALVDADVRFICPPAPKLSKKRKEEVAILHLSDIQLGKVTSTYNTEIARERVMLACRKAIEITEMRRTTASIKELRLYWGGDMIEGEDIFPHQAHLIDSPVIDQACVNGPRIFVEATLLMLQHFTKVDIFAAYGNHGRNGPKHTRSHPKTNWDRVFYHTCKVIFFGTDEHPRKELKRLGWHDTDSFYLVDRVYDWGNLLVHGHQITGGFAGFPWYGTAKKAWGWIDAINEPWDNLYFGHFHTPAEARLNGRTFYCNGTTESDNEYAQESLAACGEPSQRLQFMDAKHGVIANYLLHLRERKPNKVRFKA